MPPCRVCGGVGGWQAGELLKPCAEPAAFGALLQPCPVLSVLSVCALLACKANNHPPPSARGACTALAEPPQRDRLPLRPAQVLRAAGEPQPASSLHAPLVVASICAVHRERLTAPGGRLVLNTVGSHAAPSARLPPGFRPLPLHASAHAAAGTCPYTSPTPDMRSVCCCASGPLCCRPSSPCPGAWPRRQALHLLHRQGRLAAAALPLPDGGQAGALHCAARRCGCSAGLCCNRGAAADPKSGGR